MEDAKDVSYAQDYSLNGEEKTQYWSGYAK